MRPLHSHLFRHQILTFLTAKWLSDARIRLISRHETRKSLKVYQHPSLESAENAYQNSVQSVWVWLGCLISVRVSVPLLEFNQIRLHWLPQPDMSCNISEVVLLLIISPSRIAEST
jgi:hypothetical protein